MSETPSTVLNGPATTENRVPFNDAQTKQEMPPRPQSASPQQPVDFKPPLNRIDSRTSFPPRPGFAPQTRPPFRGPPPGQPPFIQRPPRPPIRQQPPNFRPGPPFPRSPLGLFQQRSVPPFQRPPLEVNVGEMGATGMPPLEAMRSKSLSLGGSNGEVPVEVLKMEKIEENGGRKSVDLGEKPKILEEVKAKPTVVEDVEKERVKFDESVIEKEEMKIVEPKKMELKNLVKTSKSPSRAEGDNDSGVDESTQGNDQSSNGDHNSPRKSSGKTPSRTSSTTPTKNRSLSRGSKSPSLKSPDSTASTPGTAEKKKLPMNKVQVGSAPSPNLKEVRSKIGSLQNATYKPGGGNVKIENKKIDFKNASSRIEAKNEKYAPKGGEKKIQHQKLQWNAKSKIGSLENATHKPKGGEKKIESVKLDFKEKAKSKVGSKDNMKHVPGGGDIKNEPEEENVSEIENKKLDIKAQSKIGSLNNVKHKPGGGEKKIFDDKDYLKQRSSMSSENHSLTGSQAQRAKSAKPEQLSKSRTLEDIQGFTSARLSYRSSSLRVKKSATPRPPWRF